MGASKVSGPKDFLDNLEDKQIYGLQSPPRRKVPAQEPTPPLRGIPDKLDTTTAATYMAGLADSVWNDGSDNNEKQLTTAAKSLDARVLNNYIAKNCQKSWQWFRTISC